MINNKEKGNYGESFAREYLENIGYTILETQYYTPYGEIDIIAENNNSVIFIEVKYRSTKKMGTPLEAINKKKQSKIINCANHYIVEKNLDCDMRFDAIGILGTTGDVEHIENAFLM